jgi:nucleoside-diphosphate-sugar epimerase
MKKKLLITGASGFIGSHLIEQAVELGYDVYAGVRGSSRFSHLEHLSVKFVQIDLSSLTSIRAAFIANQFEYIIHSAGLTKAKNWEEYKNVNAVYSANIAHIANEFNIQKFVFLSSLATLGPRGYNDTNRIVESSEPFPITNYGKSKLEAELMLQNIENLPLIIIRPTAVYGPREKDIFIMFKTLNSGLEPYIGNTPQWFSFIYVFDLVEAIFLALQSNKIREIYNISDGEKYNRYELANQFKLFTGKKTLKLHFPLPVVKVIASSLEFFSKNSTPALNKEKLNELIAENWDMDVAKAKNDLGFQPKFNLAKGIEETIRWYKENNWL